MNDLLHGTLAFEFFRFAMLFAISRGADYCHDGASYELGPLLPELLFLLIKLIKSCPRPMPITTHILAQIKAPPSAGSAAAFPAVT